MISTPFDPILPKPQGAINTYTYELSKRLSQWALVDLFGRGRGNIVEHNLRISSFAYNLPPVFLKYTRIREFTFSLYFNNYTILHVKRQHQRSPVDILHINSLYQSPAAKLLRQILNIKTVCSIHNTFQVPLMLQYCDKILANSNYMKNFMVNDRGFEKKKIDVLPIAIDTDTFKPQTGAKKRLGLSDRDIILFVGRKCPYKGPQVLIEALPKIRKKHPKSLVVLIGPDYFFGSQTQSYSSFLREKARLLAVQGNIIFENYVSDSLLRDYYNAADVFVCPSIWQEPFGKVVIEANACKKPVVATNVGGLPEIIQHGKNGLIVPPDDASKLSNAVCQLLDHKKMALSMGEMGRKIVESHFSFDIISKQCQRIYKEII